MEFLNNPLMGRRVVYTNVTYFDVDKNGAERKEVILYGSYTTARAEKYLKNKLKKPRLFVTDTKKNQAFLECRIQDYVNLC
ncbi:MAG: hypothetical protein K2H01_11060, partial [Ruminococcus sp.]|nr:hypothetical protein [Ruminococcus sp.]